jgi:sulfate transport system substrate-binding protein
MLAEPSVSVVDRFAKKKGTGAVAHAYLEYMYSDEGQEIMAQNFYRPRNAAIAAKYAHHFPSLELVTIDDPLFVGWPKTQKVHFADGGIFDQLYLRN